MCYSKIATVNVKQLGCSTLRYSCKRQTTSVMKYASVLDAQIFHTSPAKAVALKMIQKRIWVVIWRKKTCRIAGMDLLVRCVHHPYPWPEGVQGGGRGIFHDKAKYY
jgi:hypothetical protein